MAWPLPADLDEAQLEERLYGQPAGSRRSRQLEQIDFAAVHKELKARKNLTGWRQQSEFLSKVHFRWTGFALEGGSTLVTTTAAFTEFPVLDRTLVGGHAAVLPSVRQRGLWSGEFPPLGVCGMAWLVTTRWFHR
ncbi:MAG: hypothetical protein OXC19_18140 [Bryobacterales bacterium]|nr:hypothetical protein [Bryobacterales bacterium]